MAACGLEARTPSPLSRHFFSQQGIFLHFPKKLLGTINRKGGTESSFMKRSSTCPLPGQSSRLAQPDRPATPFRCVRPRNAAPSPVTRQGMQKKHVRHSPPPKNLNKINRVDTSLSHRCEGVSGAGVAAWSRRAVRVRPLPARRATLIPGGSRHDSFAEARAGAPSSPLGRGVAASFPPDSRSRIHPGRPPRRRVLRHSPVINNPMSYRNPCSGQRRQWLRQSCVQETWHVLFHKPIS